MTTDDEQRRAAAALHGGAADRLVGLRGRLSDRRRYARCVSKRDRRRRSVWPARLHVVTGKGGTGKTTRRRRARAGAGRRRPAHPARRGRGPAGHRAAVRHRAAALRGAHDRRRRAGGGEVRALAVDAEEALLEYLEMFYKLGAAGRALRKFGAIDFATTIAPGLRDVLLTGKVKEATTRTARRQAGVRRGGARRAADRPDRPVPQRHRGDRPAGQGGADQDPERGRRRAAALPDDRGARGDAARGDAGTGDGRRDRRADAAAASRSARSIVNGARPPLLAGRQGHPGRAEARPGRGRPADRPGHGGRPARRGAGPPDPPRARGVAARRAGRARPADDRAAAAAPTGVDRDGPRHSLAARLLT